jgi:hypothetical protein
MSRARELTSGRINGADPELWLELRLEATRRHVPMHEVWDEIMRDWLERRAASQPAPNNGRATAAVTA